MKKVLSYIREKLDSLSFYKGRNQYKGIIDRYLEDDRVFDISMEEYILDYIYHINKYIFDNTKTSVIEYMKKLGYLNNF